MGIGILVESQGPTWMYGTASEHNVLYQYQLYGAQNLFMGMIQTESPYFQPKPAPPAPFGTTLGHFAGDIEPDACAANDATGGAGIIHRRIGRLTELYC